MYSEKNTEFIIKNRMINNIPSDIDSSEGSLIYDAISPASMELDQAYIKLDQALDMVFAQSAATNGYSAQLELRCGEFGVIRKIGTLAIGQVTFSGIDTTVIPQGTVIQTPGGLQYETIASATISAGLATVNIQSVNIGLNYDVPSNTIIQIPTTISGITGVINISPTLGGTDNETDIDLLQRLLTQVQTPATSGNVAHYVQWAMQVNGIGLAQVFPLWNGPGTVKVCAVDSNMQPISSTLLINLSNYIESRRPIGALVTYESAIAVPINISVNVVRDTAYTQEQILTALTTSIINYLKGIYSKQNYVSYAVIGSLIVATPGVIDYNALTVNGGTVNVAITSEQVATKGTITVNAT
jgi:uncharacterized phage protein gp47/JayE